MHPPRRSLGRWLGVGVFAGLCLLLAAFFGFVGFMKATASSADLARYGAWTVHIPPVLGRAVGWSEIALALALLGGLLPRPGPRLSALAAGLLLLNQIVAAMVHANRGELSALPQNMALIVACAVIIGLQRWAFGNRGKEGELA